MKKVISAILAIITVATVALLTASCGEKDASAPDGMVKASAENIGYSFYVPSSWKCDVASGATTAYYSSSDASNVSVMSFSAKNTDFTADSWWDGFLEDFNNTYSEFELISTEEAALDSSGAKKYVYTGKLGEVTYKFMQVVTVKKESLSAPQIIIFTYTSVPDIFDSHLDDVQKMLDNFKFN